MKLISILITLMLTFSIFGQEQQADVIHMFKGIEYKYTQAEHDDFIKKIMPYIDDLSHVKYSKRLKAIRHLQHLGVLHHEAESKMNIYYDTLVEEYDYEDDEDYDDGNIEDDTAGSTEHQSPDVEQYDRKYSYLILHTLTQKYNESKDLEWKLNAILVLRQIHDIFWDSDCRKIKTWQQSLEEALDVQWTIYQKDNLCDYLVNPPPFE